MGQSNSIEDQAKSNREFQKYLDDQQKVLDDEVAKGRKAIDDDITQHYANVSDSHFLIGGTSTHMTTLSEWSLDSVNKMIDTIQVALLGKAAPPADTPTSSTKIISADDKKKADLGPAIQEMASMDLLVASTVFATIQGLLEGFASSTKTDLQTNHDIAQPSPGLSVFIYIIENNMQDQRFFSNNLICQNIYLYEARYSITEGKAVINFNQLQALADVEASYDTEDKKIASALAALDPTADKFEEQNAKYAGFLENIKTRRAAITEQINAIKPG